MLRCKRNLKKEISFFSVYICCLRIGRPYKAFGFWSSTGTADVQRAEVSPTTRSYKRSCSPLDESRARARNGITRSASVTLSYGIRSTRLSPPPAVYAEATFSYISMNPSRTLTSTTNIGGQPLRKPDDTEWTTQRSAVRAFRNISDRALPPVGLFPPGVDRHAKLTHLR